MTSLAENRPTRTRTAVRLSELPAPTVPTEPSADQVVFVTNALGPRPSLGRRNEVRRRPVICAVVASR